MAAQQVLLSPAELDYLHTSLSLRPPIRPDGRTSTQFRPLTAETGILQGTNGSACVTFADGAEAIVGIKAEIEKTVGAPAAAEADESSTSDADKSKSKKKKKKVARGDWVEITIEIPSQRDDDAGTVFLGEMLREALLGDGEFMQKLWINSRFHWRLYIDVRCHPTRPCLPLFISALSV
jgi:exosome complex component RRP42